ncbi:hypothetical protein CRV24_007518 [Beauveria bassiana]|nr:hypothetical protein CRV24_007518 [Beauveria bassiana]
MPPAEIRVFAFDVNTRKVDYGPGDRDGDPDDPANFLKCGERPNLTKLPGTELGKILLEDGSIVNAGRAMMRDTWNTALHGPLAEAYEAGKKTARPDVWIHKNRNSGLWNDKPDFAEYLEKGKVCTLLFSGVNTDQCAGATLQDAHAQGFDTIFLKNGCGTDSLPYTKENLRIQLFPKLGLFDQLQGIGKSSGSELTSGTPSTLK